MDVVKLIEYDESRLSQTTIISNPFRSFVRAAADLKSGLPLGFLLLPSRKVGAIQSRVARWFIFIPKKHILWPSNETFWYVWYNLRLFGTDFGNWVYHMPIW
jgi:hypothetical protein